MDKKFLYSVCLRQRQSSYLVSNFLKLRSANGAVRFLVKYESQKVLQLRPSCWCFQWCLKSAVFSVNVPSSISSQPWRLLLCQCGCRSSWRRSSDIDFELHCYEAVAVGFWRPSFFSLILQLTADNHVRLLGARTYPSGSPHIWSTL